MGELRKFKGSAVVQGTGKLMSNFVCAARFKMMIKERISSKFEEKYQSCCDVHNAIIKVD